MKNLLWILILATGCTATKTQHVLVTESNLTVDTIPEPIRTPEYVERYFHGAIAQDDFMLAPGSIFRVSQSPQWNLNAFNGGPQTLNRTNLPHSGLLLPSAHTNNLAITQLQPQLQQLSTQLSNIFKLHSNTAKPSSQQILDAATERVQKLQKD